MITYLEDELTKNEEIILQKLVKIDDRIIELQNRNPISSQDMQTISYLQVKIDNLLDELLHDYCITNNDYIEIELIDRCICSFNGKNFIRRNK